MLCVSFPPPDRTVLGIHDRPDVHKTTLREHARGRIRLRARMRPNKLHPCIPCGEMNQRAGGLGRVSPPFPRRHHAIRDLDHAVPIGPPLETGAADDLPTLFLDDPEAMTPGV